MTYFSPEQLAQLVKETIPDAVPGDRSNAVVATVDLKGARIVASFTRPWYSATWQLQAVAEHDWTGDNTVGAKVLLSW